MTWRKANRWGLVVMAATVLGLIVPTSTALAQRGGVRLQGKYERRYNDPIFDRRDNYIVFTPDGRFEERGFLAAALGSQILPDGRVVFYDPQAGGWGTFRVFGTTLELTYANGESVRMRCIALGDDDPATTIILNTRYAFIRVGG